MIHSFIFAEGQLVESDVDISTVPVFLKDEGVHLWIDLENPTEAETQKVLEHIFQFHPLAIEDCVHLSQTPKVEEYDGYLFFVIHAVDFSRTDEAFHTEELNLFLGKNYLVTWHREPLKSIQATLERCRRNSMIARGSDRVAHSILDALVDNYMPVINELGEDISDLETYIVEGHDDNIVMNRVIKLKKEVQYLCQIMRPQVEVIARFARGEFKTIRSQLVPYYRDISDHLSRYNQMAESFRDNLNGTMQLYLSISSNRTSEVVKLLTLFTVVTTPVMVIGTWFGMNFKNMPELDWKWSYPLALSATVLSTVACIIYFKKRKWM